MLKVLHSLPINQLHCGKRRPQQIVNRIDRLLSTQKKDLQAEPLRTSLNGAEEFLKKIAEEWKHAKPFKQIPGPSKLQTIRGFMRGGEFHGLQMTEFISRCRQKYGDVCLLPGPLGKGPFLSTFHPTDFERVQRTEGAYPVRPGSEAIAYYRLRRKDGFFKEIQGLLADGKSWSEFRSKVNPVLMKPQNARLYLDPLQRVSSEFIQRVRDVRDPVTQEVPDNFINDIQRLTLESVAVVGLEKELGLLRRNTNSADAQQLFESTHIFLKALYDLDVKPSFYRYLPSPTYKRFAKAMDCVFDISRQYIEEALERIQRRGFKQAASGSDSVLEKLLNIDRKVAIVMAMDMLFAGVDTTTSVLAAALLLLAKNPDKQSKLRGEILSVVPSKEPFTVDNMEHLPYLRAAIKETLRVYPLTAGNFRETGQDLVLGGYRVPKGMRVLMNFNMLLSEDRYFPRPKEFVPERWIRGEPERLLAKDLNPFVYQPFGLGPRTCIGKRIVLLELELALANLLRNFLVEFNHPTENAFANHMISYPVIPLKFKFTDL